MREILFRGKRLDNGEWVEGFYRQSRSGVSYISGRESGCGFITSVRAHTIGQYTGLTDKNGKKIFEGDIVRHTDYKSNRVYEIVWNDLLTGYWYFRNDTFYSMLTEGCEVIGNKWDNPELLEGER